MKGLVIRMDITTIFTTILNMSVTATYCIAAVILLRLLLRKQPKIFSYLLWSVVLFRLLCPVTANSDFSLVRLRTNLFTQERTAGTGAVDNTAWQDKEKLQGETEQSGDKRDGADNVILSGDRQKNVEKFRMFLVICGWIWLAGVAVFIGYGSWSAFRLRRFLHRAVHIEGKAYEVDGIPTAFVFGIVSPRIYLPGGLSAQERRYVLAHERVHLARRDYLVKILVWISVCVHWVNPFVWIAFALIERDMEMSCDEAVLREMGLEVKQEYSRALLSLSCEKMMDEGCPLAFGKGDVKNRIRNILSYRKRTFVAVTFVAVLMIAVVLGLSLNPTDEKEAAERLRFGEKREFVEHYANTYCERDGDALVGFYIDEATAFENVYMLEKAGGRYTFGISSPWPIVSRYMVHVEEEKGESSAQIWYYAWSSDPHVSVWKETIRFIESEKGYRVIDSDMKYFNEIVSREDFEEAYMVAGEYAFVDYVEWGFVEAVNYQTEYDKEEGDGTDRNAVYRSPERAAAWILNLSGGEGVWTTDSSGKAMVEYTFADGSSVEIPMCDANFDSQTDNSSMPEEGETQEREKDGRKNETYGPVWIVDSAFFKNISFYTEVS